MPRRSKVSPAEARLMLEEHDQGATLDQIADKFRRSKRTVSDHIEKARDEHRFEQVKREQLGRALRQHQDDLVGFLGDLGAMVVLPSLEPHHTSISFGLSGSGHDTGPQRRTVPLRLGPGAVGIGKVVSGGDHQISAINVTVVNDWPIEIELTARSRPTFDYLRHHLSGDRLWKDLDKWETALLDELQTRAKLNRAIAEKAADIFNAPVRSASEAGEPSLTNVLPPFVGHYLMQRKGGTAEKLSDVVKLERRGLHDLRSNSILGTNLEVNAPEFLARLLDDVERTDSMKEMLEAHEHLRRCVKQVHLAIEQYYLIHYIRGICSICKRLGGR